MVRPIMNPAASIGQVESPQLTRSRRTTELSMAQAIFRSGMAAIAVVPFALTAGCGGVSEFTKERVARSETAVVQAQQTLGGSENGAIELQRARDHLEQAKQAMDKGDEKKAERYAQYAQLDAELAVTKAQSAAARKAANELLASIDMLRQEAQRATPTSR
jgi:hypothetical protein